MIESDRELLFNRAREALLAAFPDAWAIYVYGSFARQQEWPDSDVDFAVLLPPGKRIEDILSVIGQVAERVGRNVDLVDMRRIGDVLRREVLAAGRTLFISKPDSVLAWEASAMSRYARHREEIKDILADFERTGVGYAP